MHERSKINGPARIEESSTTRLRLASQADADAWDSYVASHPRATAYHRWAYKTALETSYGLKTFYVIAESEKGVIQGVLPAARIR
ncbi:MAG: hypothetical protein AAGA95_07080, partial [Pseudomonadota bacterium]